jgi:hypothetical protein
MRSHKSTQTSSTVASSTVLSFKSAALDSDPLSISCANIIAVVRNVESQLMAAIGLQRSSQQSGGSDTAGGRVVRGFEDYILRRNSADTLPATSNTAAKPEDVGRRKGGFGSQQLVVAGVGGFDVSSMQILDAPIVTEELVDEFVRHRMALLTVSIIRQAEASIAEELTRITQLVPLSKEGGTYARAPLVSSPTPAMSPRKHMSPPPEVPAAPRGAAGSPGSRPAGPGMSRPLHEAAASRGDPRAARQHEGSERLQALMDLVKSPRPGSPTRSARAAPEGHFVRHTGNYFDLPQANSEHQKRMAALQQLADKFAKPHPISQYTPPAPMPGTTLASGGGAGQRMFSESAQPSLELSSARARQYAEQLSSLVADTNIAEETGSIGSSGGFADVVRPSWRASF